MGLPNGLSSFVGCERIGIHKTAVKLNKLVFMGQEYEKDLMATSWTVLFAECYDIKVTYSFIMVNILFSLTWLGITKMQPCLLKCFEVSYFR